MQKLQEFINNTLLFAQAVGADIWSLKNRVYNLELLNLNPVQYVNQVKAENERTVARNNIRTNLILRGTTLPEAVDWDIYTNLVLQTGDKYIHENLADSIKDEYTYYKGNGLVLPSWVKVTLTIEQVKKKTFIYDGSTNTFNIAEPVKQILDVMVEFGANYDQYIIDFNVNDMEITLDSDILSEGNIVKFLYKA